MHDDEEFEAYLRHFEPVAPAPLPRRQVAWRLPAAAVLAACALGGAMLLVEHPPQPGATVPPIAAGPTPTALPPRALLQLDEAQLGSALDDVARQSLPDPARHGHALRGLSLYSDDL